VRGVDGEHVDAGADQRLDAGLAVGRRRRPRADAETAALVLAGEGIVGRLLDVLHGDEAAQAQVVVDDEQLLDAVRVQDVLRLLEADAGLGR
jgi:hypothetical protein